MKRLISLFLLLGTVQLFAQNYPVTGINISMPATPDANTANWGQGISPFTISAKTQLDSNKQVTGAVMESRILVTIKRDGSKVCGSNTSSSAASSNFNNTFKVWNGRDAASLLGQDCVLPPGEYQLCVQFFGSYNGKDEALSEEKCKNFVVKGAAVSTDIIYQPPQAASPEDGTVIKAIDAKKPVVFRWVPVIPKPSEGVVYNLKVIEISKGQSATEAMKSGIVLFEKEVLNQTQYVVGNGIATWPKAADSKYGWYVEAANKNGRSFGSSGVNTFSVKENDIKIASSTPNHIPPPPVTPPSAQRTAAPACTTTSTTVFAVGSVIHLSDDFELKLTEAPTGDNTQLTGKGTVDVKWIGLLNVQFDKIKINADDKLCEGAIYTVNDSHQEFPTQWAKNILLNTGIPAWTVAKIKSVVAGIDSNKITKPLIEAANNITTPASQPLNMPLGYFKNGDDALGVLGFTEMVFKPDQAEFELIASLNTSKVFKEPTNTLNGTDAIGLQGSGIVFTNAGLKAINGEIKLVDPVTFTYTTVDAADLKMTFNIDETGHIGNGIVFSDTEDEFWKYNLDITVELPNSWLIPVDPDKTTVDLNFQSQIIKWDNYILEATIPACIIPNTNGLGFKESTIVYDHSSEINYSDMVFPENYGPQESNDMFSGFYIKSFEATLPDGLRTYTDTTRPISLGTQDLIINKDGITGRIFAHNLLYLSYPDVNVGNLAASIDTIEIELFKKVLTQARMTGKITLPLSSKDDAGAALSYEALFIPSNTANEQTRSLTFTLTPDADIKSKLFGDGLIQIDQTSSLNLAITKKVNEARQIKLDVDVNGKLYYPTGTIANPINPSKPFNLDLSCKFEHMKMNYENTAEEKFTFSAGNWSFASPQKKLAGFAFSITDVKPIIGSFNLNGQYIFKGGLEFVAKINIGSENSKIQIAGDVKIQLLAGIKSSKFNASGVDTTGTKVNEGFLANLKPVFLGVRVSNVNVDVHMVAVDIKGSIVFYKDDAVYGTGFRGDISAKFKTLEMSIQASAQFGNTKYIPGNTSGFKYWMIQAQVVLPPPGIVFMTGLAFRGFGAGVYSRMQIHLPDTFDYAAASGSTFGGATFTPDITVSIGFKVKAIIATTPKEETFNGSVALAGEFNTNGGMNFIQIEGLFNCGSKINDEENSAFANGGISVTYNFVTKVFSLISDLNIDVRSKGIKIFTPSPIHTVLYIDGKNNQWYFKSGTPNNPMTVNAYDVLAQSYLMFGNYLTPDIPSGFMQATRDGWESVGLGSLTFTDNATNEGKYKNAKGFAFGAALNYRKTDNKHFDFWDGRCNFSLSNPKGDAVHRYLDIYFNVAAGGEVDASLLQYSGCPGFNNGWRAKVSAAIYAGASVSYDANLPLRNSCSSEQGPLASFAIGAMATLEFPNTTYFKGTAKGKWKVGKYEGDFVKEIEEGTLCGGTEIQLDPSINENVYNQENVADSFTKRKRLITKIITPGYATDVSRKTYFAALLDYPYNEPFDVQEQQSSGEMRVRTFKAVYSASLIKDSPPTNTDYLNNTAANKSIMVTGNTDPSGTGQTSASANAVNTPLIGIRQNVKMKKEVTSLAVSTTKSNSPLKQAPNMAAANNALRLSIDLADAGYDALGAKQFKLAGSSGFNTVALDANTSYKFTVDAALQENINGVWKPVFIKATTIPIKQTLYYYFKTNSESVDMYNNSATPIKIKSF